MLEIKYLSNTLSYQKLGTGNQYLILFHGFGQDHRVFLPFANNDPDRYTYLLIDLPYHGKSSRPDEPLYQSEWNKLFSRMLEKEKIETFSIGGFSLGGRFALTTAYYFADQIDKLYLIAPDGIYKNIWYRIATGIFKGSFKSLMKNPSLFFRLLDRLDEWKLINPSISKFARQELTPKENRIKVYQSWVYLKPLGHKPKQLIDCFNRSAFPIHLLLGQKDNIIKPNKITPVFQKANHCEIQILPLKHHHLVDASFDWIK